MNCQDFQTTITDLGRGDRGDAPGRESLLTHISSCSSCRERLTRERALTEGLRRVADLARAFEAPPSVEEHLLLAFRHKHSLSLRTAKSTYRLTRDYRRALTALAAAVVLVVVGLIAWRVWRGSPGEQRHDHPGSQAVAPVPPVPPQVATPSDLTEERPVFTAAPKRHKKPDLRTYRAGNNMGNSNSRDRSQRTEIATDFLPIGDANLIPFDGGSVVRVELPRTALVSFGLPMNAEHSQERIKADVVIGNDGLARAIRFVR